MFWRTKAGCCRATCASVATVHWAECGGQQCLPLGTGPRQWTRRWPAHRPGAGVGRSFARRQTEGGRRPSTHSQGIAVDLNAVLDAHWPRSVRSQGDAGADDIRPPGKILRFLRAKGSSGAANGTVLTACISWAVLSRSGKPFRWPIDFGAHAGFLNGVLTSVPWGTASGVDLWHSGSNAGPKILPTLRPKIQMSESLVIAAASALANPAWVTCDLRRGAGADNTVTTPGFSLWSEPCLTSRLPLVSGLQ